MYICMNVCMNVCMCVCTHTYIRMYVIHIYIHVTSELANPYHILRPHAVKDFVFYVLLKLCFFLSFRRGPPL